MWQLQMCGGIIALAVGGVAGAEPTENKDTTRFRPIKGVIIHFLQDLSLECEHRRLQTRSRHSKPQSGNKILQNNSLHRDFKFAFWKCPSSQAMPMIES